VTSTTDGPCPQTRRYWKDNPILWPVDTLILGSQTYSQSELQKIIDGDVSLVLAEHLIPAKASDGKRRNGLDRL